MPKASKAAELRAINAALNALDWSRSDDDPPRDLLVESGQILRHETLKLATSAHLDAVVQLVKEAHRLIKANHDLDMLTENPDDEVSIEAWLTSAEKVL